MSLHWVGCVYWLLVISGVARVEVMEGQTQLTCIPRKTLDNVNVNHHAKG